MGEYDGIFLLLVFVGCMIILTYNYLFVTGEKPAGFLLTLNNGTILDCNACSESHYTGSCLNDGGVFVCNNKSYSPNVYTEYTKKSERCTDAIIVKCNKGVD